MTTSRASAAAATRPQGEVFGNPESSIPAPSETPGPARRRYFAFILSEQKAWQSLLEWMDSADLAVDLTDEKYNDVAYRQQHFDHIQTVMECFFLLQDAHTAYHEGQRRGLPIGVINAPEELFEDEHLQARGFFVDVDQPGFGTVTRPGAIMRFSAFDPAAPAPAPLLGRHTETVLGPKGSS